MLSLASTKVLGVRSQLFELVTAPVGNLVLAEIDRDEIPPELVTLEPGNDNHPSAQWAEWASL